MRRLSSQENNAQAEASVVNTEELVLEAPEESAMGNILTEIKLLTETGPNSQLIEVP